MILQDLVKILSWINLGKILASFSMILLRSCSEQDLGIIRDKILARSFKKFGIIFPQDIDKILPRLHQDLAKIVARSWHKMPHKIFPRSWQVLAKIL